VIAISPMVKGNMGEFLVRIVHSDPEDSACLNTCALMRCESIVATPDPSLSLSLLRDEQRVSFGEFVDGRYVLFLTINISSSYRGYH